MKVEVNEKPVEQKYAGMYQIQFTGIPPKEYGLTKRKSQKKIRKDRRQNPHKYNSAK